VCKIRLPTTFRERLWVPFVMVIGWNLHSNLWPLKMGPIAALETSSTNLSYTTCKNPKIENRYSFHGESLKWRTTDVFNVTGLRTREMLTPVPSKAVFCRTAKLYKLYCCFVTNSESFVYLGTKHAKCIFICSLLSSVIKEVFMQQISFILMSE
jgi:hypothetical protein